MAVTNRMTCEDAVRQFFAYLDRALAGEALESLEAHLATCLDCCDRLQFSRELDEFVKARVGEPAVPEHVEARVRRMIEIARGRAPGSGAR